MDPRVGFVTQLGMDPLTAIERAGALGFDYVELMLDGETAPHRVADRHDEFADAVADADLDVLVHLPFGGVDIASPFDGVREGSCRAIEDAIDVASALDAEKGVLHAQTNVWGPAWDAEELRPHLVESVAHLAEYGRERDFEVCVENIPRGHFTTTDVPDVVSEAETSMTLDTGHARIDGYDADGMANLVRDAPVSHVHLNDTRRARDEHLAFGSGTIDFATLFDAFADDWAGTLSLEVFTLDYDYLDVSKERLDAMVDERR
ncbi:sugar phosphate isomerase/epimerase family protein [Halomarina salina]|uniref:Sugar phosphate isomerase/epimerase family protein n=1 Tax=Halomarina salina TaxID=1872699 RepID=A0ABD5RPU9_9EURY|nr:sugar phosphate isomerase/epimerase family protein [Halomarina salina]